MTYFEWARPDYQRVLLPWTVIGGAQDAAAFADAIEALRPRPKAERRSLPPSCSP